MSRPVIFDLFHTLVHGADEERDRVVGEMAVMVGVAPAELVAAYHATWRDRLVRWDVRRPSASSPDASAAHRATNR